MTSVARAPSPAKCLKSKGSARRLRRWMDRFQLNPSWKARFWTQIVWVARRFSTAVKALSEKWALAPEVGKHSFSAISLAIPLLLTACGYHTAGHAITFPTDVHTIAVPAFANNTETYKVDQMLTAAVVRELITRTHYHVLNRADEATDATLRGTVLSTYNAPLTYDSQTGRVASVLITVNMKVMLTDRRGKVLYQNPAYVFREQYEVSSELNSFFEEDSPALQRLSRDFARTLVSNILEGF
jgi:outer membrane lipopolysaccharide assembly protein LptE/RlpB